MVGIRVSCLMLSGPFFSNRAIPILSKVGLLAVLTGLLYPIVAPPPLPENLGEWLAVAGHETAVGLMIGLTLNFVFEGVQLAGQIVGFQFGFSLANVIDPQTQVDTPVLSVFHQLVALLIFLRLDVHHWLLRGLGKSFEYLPAGSALSSMTVDVLFRMAGGLWVIGIQIAAPVLLATFAADVALGFLAKASPQFPILFLAIPAKSLLGYSVLLGAVAFWPGILQRHFLDALSFVEQLLKLA